MTHVPSFPLPPRVPPVDPDLLASAVFVFGEYLAELEAETRATVDDDEEPDEDDEDEGLAIDTAVALDRMADDLGTSVPLTLTLYMRVTALYRLLAASPSLARLATDEEEPGGPLTEDALVAAAKLDLRVVREGEEGAADFDPREFRDALLAP